MLPHGSLEIPDPTAATCNLYCTSVWQLRPLRHLMGQDGFSRRFHALQLSNLRLSYHAQMVLSTQFLTKPLTSPRSGSPDGGGHQPSSPACLQLCCGKDMQWLLHMCARICPCTVSWMPGTGPAAPLGTSHLSITEPCLRSALGAPATSLLQATMGALAINSREVTLETRKMLFPAQFAIAKWDII